MESEFRFFNIIIFFFYLEIILKGKLIYLSMDRYIFHFSIGSSSFRLFQFGIWSHPILVLWKEFNADVAQMFSFSLYIFAAEQKRGAIFFLVRLFL